MGKGGRGRAQRQRLQAELDAELNAPQHLPEQAGGSRLHQLDSGCWCGPTLGSVHGRPALVHQADHPAATELPPPEPPQPGVPQVNLLGDLQPMVVRTPRKRSPWGRPWERR